MRTIVCSILFILTSATACTQEKKDNSTISLEIKTIKSIPFLTKNNDFVYVDKISLKPVNSQKFKNASVFTSTGFAVVENEKNEYAVIDESGNKVLGFSSSPTDLNVVNGLTFYKRP
jgi:hypothetical protein